MPTGVQMQGGGLDFTNGVAAFHLEGDALAFGNIAKAEVNVGAAPAGVAAAAIDLGNEFVAVGQTHCGGRAECGTAGSIGAGVAGAGGEGDGERVSRGGWARGVLTPHPGPLPVEGRGRVKWEEKMEAEKGAGVGRFVVEKEGGLPLVGKNEIEQAIAVDVGEGDAFADHGLGKTYFGSEVVVTAIGSADEKRIGVVAAEIGAGFEIGPKS